MGAKIDFGLKFVNKNSFLLYVNPHVLIRQRHVNNFYIVEKQRISNDMLYNISFLFIFIYIY